MLIERLNCPCPPRNVRAMDKEDVASAVAAWLPALGLPAVPAAGVKDLRDVGIRIAKFTDEETAQFFFPRRSLSFQQRMVKFLAVLLRKRGAKIISVSITAEDYARWLDPRGLEDTPERRYEFASRLPVF